MTEELLKKIREEVKKELRLPYKNDLLVPKKTEDEIIMSIYQKHIGEIEEEDTRGIYYYDGTYKYIYDSWLESYGLGPMEQLVSRYDPNAHFRRYSNIEGIYSYAFSLKEADEFERTHTILYDEETTIKDMAPYWFTKDFVITAVKENQDIAINHVLKKYLKKRENTHIY